MPLLSVIIPTHRRATILSQCLDHLSRQTVLRDIEVIVVSDGHDDATSALLSGTSSRRYDFPIRFFEQEKSQQGAARNLGVQQAKGQYVLFIGDDAFLLPDTCERHLQHLRGERRCVLGFTTWDPALNITPTMYWLERSGWQFGYPMLRWYQHSLVPASLQASFTYTINISLPTEIARRYPFREGISLYGWEDIEWGTTLARAGIPLFYASDATAYHHHHLTLDDSLKRMEVLGRSAVAMEILNPSLSLTPKGIKRSASFVLSLFPTMAGKHRKAFLRGMKTW